MKNYRGPAMLAVPCVIWGVLFPASKAALSVLEPMELLFIRLVIGALCIFFFGLASHTSWVLKRRDWPLITVMSLSGYLLANWGQFYGTQLTTSQLSVVIMSTTPIGVVLLAKIILKERIGLKKWLAVCLATIGTFIIIGVGDVAANQIFGGLVLVAAVFVEALMLVLVKKVPEEYSMTTISMYCMLISAVVMAPFELSHMPSALAAMAADGTVLACVLFIGIFATGVAYCLWNKGMTYGAASTSGMYLFIQPVVGTLLGWAWLGETVGLPFFIGTALILGGAALIAKE